MDNEKEKIIFDLPNTSTIPCLTCKHGAVNFLATFCTEYKLKPKSVYYESKECEHYEPMNGEKNDF